jgi:histone H3/H4
MSHVPRGARVKDEPSSFLSSTPQASTKAPPPSIDIKTKFPVARIKRIMQADEEVGKVAQVTPVAVNKALELFMTALVLGAAERAREKGGKRITAGHLKSVVEADEQFDFLGDIVGRVQETAEGDKKRKGGKDSDSEAENSGERKVKKGKGRRKKGDD